MVYDTSGDSILREYVGNPEIYGEVLGMRKILAVITLILGVGLILNEIIKGAKRIFSIIILIVLLWIGSAQALDTLKYAVCDTSLHKDEGYDSLFVDWIAWEAMDLSLTTLNSACIVDFFNDGDTLKTWAALTIGTAWATSDSERIILRTPVSEKHDGIWGTGFRVTTDSDAHLIIIEEAHVRIEGLVLYQSKAYDIIRTISMPTPSDVRISNCLLKGTGATKHGIHTTSANNMVKIKNNFFDTISGASGVAIWIYNCADVWIYNNTAYNVGGPGINVIKCPVYAKNNIVIGSGGPDFQGTFLGGDSSDYNCSGDATAPGTHSIKNKAAYDIFADTTKADPDLHLKSGSVCIDSGVDLSSDPDLPFSDDIDGDTRTGTWDIGADEYVAERVIERVKNVNVKGANIK